MAIAPSTSATRCRRLLRARVAMGADVSGGHGSNAAATQRAEPDGVEVVRLRFSDSEFGVAFLVLVHGLPSRGTRRLNLWGGAGCVNQLHGQCSRTAGV